MWIKMVALMIALVAFSSVAFAGDEYYIIKNDVTQINMTNVTILNEFDQSLNTTDNVSFYTATLGSATSWITQGFWDLSAYGIGDFAYLEGHSTGGGGYLDGYLGLYGSPLIIKSSGNPCMSAIAQDQVAGGVKNFCYDYTDDEWEFTGGLSITGDFSLGGSLSGGLFVPNAQNITWEGQNGYDTFTKMDWNGGNYDMHIYGNDGTSYFGLTNTYFIIPHRLQSQTDANAHIDLDDDGQAIWSIYGDGGTRTGLTINYGGSGIYDNSTFLSINNMANPGNLLNLSGAGDLWIRKNITTINGTFKGNGSGITNIKGDNIVYNNDCGIPSGVLVYESASAVSDTLMPQGNGDILQGTPMACDGVITAISGVCENCNAGVNEISFNASINGTKVGCNVPQLNGTYDTDSSTCSIPFSKNARVGCSTNTETGTVTGIRCAIYVRYD